MIIQTKISIPSFMHRINHELNGKTFNLGLQKFQFQELPIEKYIALDFVWCSTQISPLKISKRRNHYLWI